MSGPLPSGPERWLRAVLGDTPVAASIIGDLREEYATRRPGLWRTMAYGAACVAIAVRYIPGLLFDVLRLDVRHSTRSLVRARTYVVTAVATLALGIGIAATLLTITYGSLLRPLPFPDAEQLVRIGQSPRTGPAAGSVNSMAVANLLDLARDPGAFTGLAAFQLRRTTLTGAAGAERVLTSAVTGNFFEVLGTRPLIGRTLSSSDDTPTVEPTAVITERLWRRQFSASAAIISEMIRLDGVPHRVVGVMPHGLPWPGDPEVWVPMRWTTEQAAMRRSRQIEGIGRLSAGTSLQVGLEQLRARFDTLAATYPTENGTSAVSAMPLRDWMLNLSGPNRSLLPLLASLAAVMLGLAYLNLATLSIGRREARQQEVALRHVLGASGWRLACSRWTEAGLVAAAGGGLGGLLAAWTIPVLISRYGTSIARAETITPDAVTAGLSVTMAALGALVIAIATRQRTGRTRGPGDELNRRSTTSRAPVRRRLVAVQIGLAGGLVYGAVLLSAMTSAMSRVDLGIPLDNTLTFAIGIPAGTYDTPDKVYTFFRRVREELLTLPGVVAAGGTSRTPFAGGTNGEVVNADDPAVTVPIAEWRTITPGLLDALGLRTVSGTFDDRGAEADRAVAISASLSERLFGQTPAVGRRVRVGTSIHVVAAVVSDIRDFGPVNPGRPTIYFPHGREAGFSSARELVFVVRTGVGSPSLIDLIRARVATVDAEVPIRAVATLEELATRALGVERTTAGTVLLTLAILALGLGMLGVFGVTAVRVEQQTREIGVRLALGDTPRGIVRLVLADGLRLAVAGAVLAGAGGWVVHRLVASVLVPGFAPAPMAVAAVVAVVLMVAAMVASVLPASRAARLSPTEALRADQ